MTDTKALYLVTAEAYTGDSDGPVNMDLFVFALSPDDTFKVWRQHYADHDMPRYVHIRAVPTYGTLGAVPWDTMDMVEYKVP